MKCTPALSCIFNACSFIFFSSVRGLIFHIDRLRQPAWGVSSHSWSQRCRRTPAAGVIHNAGHCSEVTFITCCAMISFLNMRERAPQSHKYGNASNMIHLFPKAEPNPTWLTRASLESIDLTWQSGAKPSEWIMLKHTSGSSVWLCRKTSVQRFLLCESGERLFLNIPATVRSPERRLCSLLNLSEISAQKQPDFRKFPNRLWWIKSFQADPTPLALGNA